MGVDKNYLDYILELLAPLGGIEAKRMFGGYGLYNAGAMFALIADNSLYFKTDEQSRRTYEAQGLAPFQYQKQGKAVTVSYYPPPVTAMEESEHLCALAREAVTIARRAKRAKP